MNNILLVRNVCGICIDLLHLFGKAQMFNLVRIKVNNVDYKTVKDRFYSNKNRFIFLIINALEEKILYETPTA